MIRAATHSLSFIIIACFALTGCGNSSDSNGQQSGVQFTEETSLDEDLTGVWIAIKSIRTDYTQQSAESQDQRLFQGSIRETIFIQELPNSDLQIFNCDGIATNIEKSGSHQITFELGGNIYTLTINSNTKMTGDVVIPPAAGEDGTGGGSAKIIKVSSLPARGDVFDDDFTLGTITYSYEEGEPQSFNVQCYKDSSGTETYNFSGKNDSSQYSSSHKAQRYTLSDFSNYDIYLSKSEDTSTNSYNTGASHNLPSIGQWSYSSSFFGSVEFSISGTDTINVEFNASFTDGDPSDSDTTDWPITFTGSGTLRF